MALGRKALDETWKKYHDQQEEEYEFLLNATEEQRDEIITLYKKHLPPKYWPSIEWYYRFTDKNWQLPPLPDWWQNDLGKYKPGKPGQIKRGRRLVNGLADHLMAWIANNSHIADQFITHGRAFLWHIPKVLAFRVYCPGMLSDPDGNGIPHLIQRYIDDLLPIKPPGFAALARREGKDPNATEEDQLARRFHPEEIAWEVIKDVYDALSNYEVWELDKFNDPNALTKYLRAAYRNRYKQRLKRDLKIRYVGTTHTLEGIAGRIAEERITQRREPPRYDDDISDPEYLQVVSEARDLVSNKPIEITFDRFPVAEEKPRETKAAVGASLGINKATMTAIDEAIDESWITGRKPRTTPEDESIAKTDDVRRFHPSAEDEAITKEESNGVLKKYTSVLPPGFHEVFWLRYRDELFQHEIADKLGDDWSEDKVQRADQKILTILRDAIEGGKITPEK